MTPLQPAARIWLVHASQIGGDVLLVWRGWLGEGEAQRHARFVRPQRRQQFIVGRGLLRLALGHMLGVPAASLQLQERRGQAPLLVLPSEAPAPDFSISHSGDWVACAVSADAPLGLDIEVMDAGRDIAAVAAQAFGDSAAAALLALPAAQSVPAFYAAWSTQEAQFKLTQGAPQTMAPVCVSVPHEILSIVVCSAAPLALAPQLVTGDDIAAAIARASSISPATGV